MGVVKGTETAQSVLLDVVSVRRRGSQLAALEKQRIPIGRRFVAGLWSVDQRIHGKQLDTRSAFRGR